jgi:mono/diheme cytochrome c family protein
MKYLIFTSKTYMQRHIVSACSLVIVLFASISVSVYADSIELVSPASDQNKLLGAYLSRAGNCMGCHTAKDGVSFAGGRRMHTSFGIFITPNITPDKKTGIGHWSKQDFWLALHRGESRDGRMLYPSFPYTEYTKVTRKDTDAIFDYLMSLSPVSKDNPSSKIFFPYNLKPLLYFWRKLYFKEGVFKPDNSKSKGWNRGAYLVQGLGHCSACHSSRNLLGASQKEKFIGKKMTGANWYAPSLTSRLEAGSGELEINEITEFLTSGITKSAVASGHMATIIRQSLQFMLPEDIRAIAIYLQSIGKENSDIAPAESFPVLSKNIRSRLVQGGKLYKQYCEDCHQSSGRGVPGIYPSLAGNRSVTMASPLNTILSVMNGGFPPTTIGNPRPYGMPPFQQIFQDEEIALVVSYIRNTWGNHSSLVTEIDIERSRSGNRN